MRASPHRDPVLSMGVGFGIPHPRDPDGHNHIHGDVTIDPRSGTLAPNDALKIGSDWFYPMRLHWSWMNLGYWLVGLASFTMLVALVTGMVIAIVGMLAANRRLPADLAGKGEWEKLAF